MQFELCNFCHILCLSKITLNPIGVFLFSEKNYMLRDVLFFEAATEEFHACFFFTRNFVLVFDGSQ